ncbi:DoxX family protein [Erythrobacter mangrovi]|uniref:DoxX family protein n=1 Tax=Erythrobacter mangrovi TaxID=2739433 RepID=A0A7D3XJQ0_9SPHN|nr:DoxX family protein [Erythrobacter mangrovi]QKG72219.1 DoxX family protein [Erythrobacter mangrovi]
MNTITESYTQGPAATSSSDWLALGARILLAAIFVLAGLSKATDPVGTMGYIASIGLPFPELALIGAIAVEVLGGLALIAGFKTRAVALVLAAFSIVTAAAFHNQLGDQTQFVMFFKNVAMAGGFLQVAAFGPGRFSIDRR